MLGYRLGNKCVWAERQLSKYNERGRRADSWSNQLREPSSEHETRTILHSRQNELHVRRWWNRQRCMHGQSRWLDTSCFIFRYIFHDTSETRVFTPRFVFIGRRRCAARLSTEQRPVERHRARRMGHRLRRYRSSWSLRPHTKLSRLDHSANGSLQIDRAFRSCVRLVHQKKPHLRSPRFIKSPPSPPPPVTHH